MSEIGDEVKVKRTCCSSSPQCKRCPVVWKRVARVGLARRVSKRRYVTTVAISKRELKPFRKA